VRSNAAQQTREQPLLIGVPKREHRTIRYTLPRGLELATTPNPATIESAFGRFELEVEVAGQSVSVATKLELRTPRIEPEQYAEFRKFLGEIDLALAQAFEARPIR
jgi:hypothetical protein